MKSIFKTLIAIGMLGACSAPAQTAIAPVKYLLTNSTTHTVAGGGTNIATVANTTINSQPFPIFRGRGFALHTSFVGTNSGTANVSFVFQFATPITNGSSLVTNWSTSTVAVNRAMAGTTRVFYIDLVPPTTMDNVAIGRLQMITNAHTASIVVDPTNTFIAVIP